MPNRRRRTAILAGGILVVLAVAAQAGSEQEAEARARRLQQELARADSLLAVGEADAVVARLERIVEQVGADPLYGWQFLERLGVARLDAGDPNGALEALEASARAERSRPSIHRNLATTLMALGRRGRALSEFRQALELAPRDCDIRLEFGQVLLEFGNTREAAVHLDRAQQLCGDRRDVRRAVAALKLAERRFDQAAGLLKDLYEEQPDPQLLRNWQAALLGAGRDAELYDLLRSLPESELDGQRLQILLETEGRLGRLDFVHEQVRRLGDAERLPLPQRLGLRAGQEARFWGAATLNLLAARDAESALRAADRAIELEPQNVVYRNNRVVALTRLGRDQEARREWERVLELDPSLAGSGERKQKE